jgi:lipopolysaccharide exporter
VNLRLGVVRGALSLGGARVASNLLGAGAILVLARLLTPEDFGIVAIATAILTVVQSSTELSLNNALIQKETVERSHIDTAWTMALIRSIIICLIFAAISWPLSVVYSNAEMVPVFIVSGVTGAMIGLQNPHIWLATNKMTFGSLALVQFSQKAIAVGFAIAIALSFRSYWAIIAGNALGAVAAALLSYVLIPYRPHLSLKHVKEIWSFSGWMFFNQLFETLNWRIDQLIIGLVVPKAQLGIYAVADNFAVIPTRETIQPIKHALFPGLANLSKDIARLTRSHLLAQSSIAMLIAPLGIGLALVSEPAVNLALGAQWQAAIPFVEICAVYYTLGTFSMGLQPVAMALGRTKLLFVRQMIAVCVKIPLIVGGLITGGLIGAALGRLISEFITVMIEFVFLRRLLDISVWYQLKQHGLTLCGLASLVLGVFLVDRFLVSTNASVPIELAVKILAGGLFYTAAIFLVWLAFGRPEGPAKDMMRLLKRMGARYKNRSKTEPRPEGADH